MLLCKYKGQDYAKYNNMDGLFGECESLTNIDLSKFNTQNTTNMDHMFYGCESLNKIDL